MPTSRYSFTTHWHLPAPPRFDGNIVAEKPLLKHLSFVMKPIFRANHEWAMRRGEDSLRREIERRRGQPQELTSATFRYG